MVGSFFRCAKFLVVAMGFSGLTTLSAAPANLYFWPSPVSSEKPEDSAFLYAWPDYQILMQTQVDVTTYTPTRIPDELAAKLDILFKPQPSSPIELYRNEKDLSWGLRIPGGSSLSPRNEFMAEAMLEGFVKCLGTLSANELDSMKEVIYGPQAFVNPNGGVNLDESKRTIASKMFDSYRTKRCETQVTVVTELTRKTSQRYIAALLTGKFLENQVTEGALLVLTTLYKDLLFNARGLWVRTTLGVLQSHIDEILAKLPASNNLPAFDRDYSSFIDFVLLTRDQSDLTKEQYLTIADACGIQIIDAIFAAFPLKKCVRDGQLSILNLRLGTREASWFVKGGTL